MGARFCSGYCLRVHHGADQLDFCSDCQHDTTATPPGNTTSTNGIGTTFRQAGAICPRCFAVPMRRYYIVFAVPVFPLLRYRIAWVERDRYVGREMVGQSRFLQFLGRPL